MKKTLLFFASLLLLTQGFSQVQFDNSSFENWENLSSPTEEPTSFSSLKTSDGGIVINGFAPQVVWRSSTAHTGSYSAQLIVAAYNGIAMVSPNGTLTNGRVHAETTAANGYVFTEVGDADHSTICTDRPDSLVGWFQFTPVGGDVGKVEVLLHDNTALGKLPEPAGPVPSHWVGKARYDITTTTSSWIRFSVPFDYYNNNSPDYILLVATSGDSLLSVTDSEALIDDIKLIYNPNLVVIDPAAAQNIDVDADGTLLTVTETPNAAVVSPITREWKFSTTAGGPYSSFTGPETGTTYLPNFSAADIYYVICETDFGTEVVISNEVEIVVTDPLANTVTVTPSATQTLLTDEDGNLLTATETPSAASSREWKSSTTSGSGYTSFGTPETGSTYTPNFSAIGTYYLICESDFSGDVQISNEVEIIVPSSAGINDEDLEFKIFELNGAINLVFEDKNELGTLSLYNMQGQEVYSSSVNSKNSTHQVNQVSGVYVYRLTSGDRIITGRIKL